MVPIGGVLLHAVSLIAFFVLLVSAFRLLLLFGEPDVSEVGRRMSAAAVGAMLYGAFGLMDVSVPLTIFKAVRGGDLARLMVLAVALPVLVGGLTGSLCLSVPTRANMLALRSRLVPLGFSVACILDCYVESTVSLPDGGIQALLLPCGLFTLALVAPRIPALRQGQGVWPEIA